MKKRYVVAGILAAAGLICGGIAYYQYYQDAHAGQEYEKIKEKVVTEEPKKPEETPKSTVEIPIDFQTLQNMNPDIYAWIKVPGTVIDYQSYRAGTDNSYYLNIVWNMMRTKPEQSLPRITIRRPSKIRTP